MRDWNYKYFKIDEVACRCGCGKTPTDDFMKKLEQLREKFGRPMRVTSGARCLDHNSRVRGSEKSKHLDGIAADIDARGQDASDLFDLAKEFGFWGRGIAKTFIHLDTRPYEERTVWQYGS
jgi:zinc D-Ala-D-Ala carboxypeptidase